MGGGASTPALAAAVSEAGGLGFLAAGYKPVDTVRADVAAVRARTGAAVRRQPVRAAAAGPRPGRGGAIRARARERHGDDRRPAPRRRRLGREAGARGRAARCRWSRSRSAARRPRIVARLQAAGVGRLGHRDDAGEARAAEAAGADALVVQGVEAGGHRAHVRRHRAGRPRPAGGAPAGRGGHARCRSWRPAGSRPAASVAAVLAAGAAAAQLGTAFMLTPESATAPAHARRRSRRRADRPHARVHRPHRARDRQRGSSASTPTDAPLGYPDVHHVTAPLRAAARERGDADGFHLWAGQAHALAEPLPAGELVRRLAAEARAALPLPRRPLVVELATASIWCWPWEPVKTGPAALTSSPARGSRRGRRSRPTSITLTPGRSHVAAREHVVRVAVAVGIDGLDVEHAAGHGGAARGAVAAGVADVRTRRRGRRRRRARRGLAGCGRRRRV